MNESPEALMDVAVDIAREAGKLLMADLPLGRRFQGEIEMKEGRELVSRVDRASETLLQKLIGDAYPTHAVVGEEHGAAGAEGGSHRWIVDPLDGTVNYLHGHPFFAVSIGVQRREDDAIVAGVVHAPYLNETFCAARGFGAFLNTKSIRLAVSNTEALADAVVTTGFSYDRARWPNGDNFARVLDDCMGVRRCGAAALDFAYVAAGRYDAFWEMGLRPWDVAGGSLLVQEAGGRLAAFDGGDDWLEGRNVIASNAHLFEAIQERVQMPARDDAPSTA